MVVVVVVVVVANIQLDLTYTAQQMLPVPHDRHAAKAAPAARLPTVRHPL